MSMPHFYQNIVAAHLYITRLLKEKRNRRHDYGNGEKMDAGAILSQRAIPITKQDDVGTMFEKLSILGKELLLETLPKLIAGEITPIPQVEEEATFSPNITREQERIDWQKLLRQLITKCVVCVLGQQRSQPIKGPTGKFGQ